MGKPQDRRAYHQRTFFDMLKKSAIQWFVELPQIKPSTADSLVEDLTRRVKHVLQVYLERGQQALSALEQRQFDEAQEILKLRNAAFHNLRAVDALALEDGRDVARDEDTQDLWERARKVDVELGKALAQAQVETKKLYERVRKTRQKIGKYRAGKESSTSFTKSA